MCGQSLDKQPFNIIMLSMLGPNHSAGQERDRDRERERVTGNKIGLWESVLVRSILLFVDFGQKALDRNASSATAIMPR